jgi:hypothetical protein
MNKENYFNKILIALVFVILVIIVFLLVPKSNNTGTATPEVVQFAKCLAEKGATMYGAYWCPHCQNEKARFGSAFEYIPYVECTKETTKCIDDGINGYPTWIFGNPKATSSRRYDGEQGFTGLAAASGCRQPLPNAAAAVTATSTNATSTQDQQSR